MNPESLARFPGIAIKARKVRKARRRFIDFIRYTKSDYLVGAFHEDLADRIDVFIDACVAGLSPRLLVMAPPRHGKSEQVSRRLPAYALGKHSSLEIILGSYAKTLSEDMNEDVQSIMDSIEYQEVFDTRIPVQGRTNSGGRRNREETFVIGGKGKVRAVGVDGPVTGKGANIFGIDDPIKNAKEAASATVRQSVWDWYVSTAYTRMEPGGGILITQTCWNEDDLAGRIQEAMRQAQINNDIDADVFDVVRYPAIATEDEEFRKKGEALHPDRYDLKALRRIRSTMGTYYWSALYQQSPSPAEGDVFLREWWRYWKQLPEIVMVKIYADTAMKKTETADYTVFQVWGLGADGNIYLLDQLRDKMESPQLKRTAISFWNKWQARPMGARVPAPVAFCVEDKASGIGLIQELKQGINGIPIIGIPREIDKLVRARSGAPSIEAGLVRLPHPEHRPTPWLFGYEDEFADFTALLTQKHDDQVDPTLDAIHDMILGEGDFYGAALRG